MKMTITSSPQLVLEEVVVEWKVMVVWTEFLEKSADDEYQEPQAGSEGGVEGGGGGCGFCSHT